MFKKKKRKEVVSSFKFDDVDEDIVVEQEIESGQRKILSRIFEENDNNQELDISEEVRDDAIKDYFKKKKEELDKKWHNPEKAKEELDSYELEEYTSGGLGVFSHSAKSLIVFGFVVGIGMVMISELAQNSAITSATNTTIQEIITGIGGFGSWIGLFVLVFVGTLLMRTMGEV